MIEPTWEENKERINGLWPSARWTPEEKELWHKELNGLNQTWLRQALDTVAKNYSAKKPTLKWVVAAFKDIRVANTVREVHTADDNGLSEEQVLAELQECREQLLAMDPELLDRAKKQVKLTTGLDIDLDSPVAGWSRISVGTMFAAIERIQNADPQGPASFTRSS